MSHDVEKEVVDEIFARSEAWENLLVLADDIGPRLAGTANEAAARDFLLDTLKRYGLEEVRAESFSHRAWTPVHEALRVTAPVTRDLSCRCGGLSPSTPSDGVEAGVVFLERGDREEFEQRKAEVRGRFVLAPYYPVARQIKTPLGAEYGAVGLIEARSHPGGLQPARTCVFARVGPIPVASISREDAEYLKRVEARKGPVRLRLTLESRVEKKDSWNVVGELGEGSEQIVVGGHYDSWHAGPGAVDNASGVVAVVEAARGLAGFRKHLRRRVKFVLFGVEESGLVGSWAFTHLHRDELRDTVLMINNDVGGRPTGLGSAGFEDLVPALEPIAAQVRIAGENLPPFRVSVGGPGWGSDHFPFVAHGVPTVGIGTTPPKPEEAIYGHTRGDTADKVYREGLTECAAINAQVILTVATMDLRPARQKTRAEIEALFREHRFMETLELLQMWPPERVIERYFSF